MPQVENLAILLWSVPDHRDLAGDVWTGPLGVEGLPPQHGGRLSFQGQVCLVASMDEEVRGGLMVVLATVQEREVQPGNVLRMGDAVGPQHLVATGGQPGAEVILAP